MGIWDLFWAVFAYIGGSHKPAKGPLDFQKRYFNIQLYFFGQKVRKLDVHMINTKTVFKLTITFLLKKNPEYWMLVGYIP